MLTPPNLPLRGVALSMSAALALLAGCGAEVAGTAATVGALQVEQARQAELQKAQILQGMKQAEAVAAARTASAAE